MVEHPDTFFKVIFYTDGMNNDNDQDIMNSVEELGKIN